MQPATETRLRVRYAETDQMGVVYYANHLVWMEVGRMAWCRECGFNYREMEREDGIFLAVAEANCRYRSPARFDDEVIIKTWLEESNSRIAIFAYEMRVVEGDGGERGERIIATGSTRHVYVGRQMQRARLPEKYFPLFGIEEHP